MHKRNEGWFDFSSWWKSSKILSSHPQFDDDDDNIDPMLSFRPVKPLTLLPLLKGLGAVALWMSLNITLSLLNKYLFKEKNFRFPILIIVCGTLVTFLGSAICVFGFKMEKKFPLQKVVDNWKLLAIIAVTHGLTTALENMSIVYISISLNQIIKATMPAGTILASMVFERRAFSRPLIVSTMVIVIGASFAVFRNPEFDWRGFFYAVGSLLFGIVQTIATGILLHRTSMSILVIALTTSLPAVMVILPGFLSLEWTELQLSVQENSNIGVLALFVLLTSCLAFFYNLSHYLLIDYTSAHYAVLVGNMKVLLLVFISMSLFNTPMTGINIFGMVISLFGFCAYNFVRYFELQATNQQKSDIEFTESVVNSLLSTTSIDTDDEENISSGVEVMDFRQK